MRKLLLLSFLLVATIAYGRKISENEAASIASEFLGSTSARQNGQKSGMRRTLAKNVEKGVDAPYYVFNSTDGNGFVIVSGDDRAKKILGYSDKGSFDFDNLPPQLDALLKQYAEQIAQLPSFAATDSSWITSVDVSANTKGVLLQTANWGQDYPYNLQTPVVNGIHCPTGCVPTAMAIMMQYYNWPERGNGKHTNFFYPDLSFDFENYTPDWSKIPLSVTDETSDEQKAEISKLMLAAGIGIDVMYNYAESGADITFLENVLSSRFNFAPAHTLYKSYMSDEDWNRTIVNELDNGRIILYGGSSDDKTSNHLFIIDGYSTNNLYHVNWGWDGDMNCYVDIGNIVVGSSDFSKQHIMVIGIEPNITDVRYSSFMVNDGIGRFDYLTNGGFNFSSDHIETGIPFQAVYPIVYGNPDGLGFVTLALINESDEIVEIISPYGADLGNRVHDGTFGCEGVYLFECGNYKLNKNCYIYCVPQLVVKSEIKPGYKLQLVGRDTPDSKWEFIAPSNQISTTVELDKPLRSEWVDVKIEYDEEFIELRSLHYFNTHDKALMDAVGRWEFVYGGGGKIVFDESSTLHSYYDDGCAATIAQTITKDINYFAKVKYISDRTIYIESDITNNQIIVDGIVYEIDADGLNWSEPNSSAKIIGYTDECPDIVKFVDNVEIAGKQYPVKSIMTGAFAGNKNIKHLNVQSDLHFCDGALSYMSGLESFSVNTNESPDGGRFLLHKSNKVENLYEKVIGPHSTAGFQFNEFLNQLAYSEWRKYGVSPDWYIQDPETLVIEDHLCIKESDNPPHFYVPGQSVNISNDFLRNVEISEMWSYEINREGKLLEIKSNYPEKVEITGVLINGKSVDNLSGKYTYKSDTSLDVVVEYTANGIQPMTTHYTPEYNQTLPSSGIRVSSISLNPSSVQAKESEQIQITATVLPEDATNKTLSWSSSDESIATVNDSGLVSLIKKGQAVITASATDESGVSAECAVVVTEHSGIEDILTDKNTYVKIFNLQGIKVYEGIYTEANLDPDYYIVVCDGKSLKVKVE